MKNIAIFASGNGTNFEAIARALSLKKIKANLTLLVCDKPCALVLKRAEKFKTKVALVERKEFSSKEEFEKKIVEHLKENKIDLVVLAGFMRLLGEVILNAYRGRIINIHPALLPSFKGAHGIKDAFDYGVKITGVTVHFVDSLMDHGAIILQEEVKIREGDSLESLEKKMHKIEHRLYPEAIKLFVNGKLKIKGRKVKVSQ